MKETFIIIMLSGLVLSAILSVMIRSLIKAAISLAIASAFLAVMMFILGAWIAAVIELSVCAGMITVVFISAISLTVPLTDEQIAIEAKQRVKRFIYLPFILAATLALAIILWYNRIINFDFLSAFKGAPEKLDFYTQGSVIWDKRAVDLLGQVIVLLSGVYGVVVLFKERNQK